VVDLAITDVFEITIAYRWHECYWNNVWMRVCFCIWLFI